MIEIVPCGTGSGFACDWKECPEEAAYDLHAHGAWLVFCERHMREVAEQIGAQVPESA